MRRAVWALVFVLLLPSCGWRRMAVERHQQSQQIRQQQIERQQLELDCLKRKEAAPEVDCAQYTRSPR